MSFGARLLHVVGYVRFSSHTHESIKREYFSRSFNVFRKFDNDTFTSIVIFPLDTFYESTTLLRLRADSRIQERGCAGRFRLRRNSRKPVERTGDIAERSPRARSCKLLTRDRLSSSRFGPARFLGIVNGVPGTHSSSIRTMGPHGTRKSAAKTFRSVRYGLP